jgi:hypothetical protein
MAARLSRAALRLMSGPAALVGCQLVRLHGMGNRPPTRRGVRVHVLGSRHVPGGDCLCEQAACRARQRLVVRGGDLSKGVPLLGNLSEKLPTSREEDVLPVMVLTRVFSPPRFESWPSCC